MQLVPKKEYWRQALQFINKCPICAGSYDAGTAELVETASNVHLVHLTCPNCHSYFLAMVVALGQSLSSIGMVTDLTAGDAQRLAHAPPLTTDEIISLYEHMQQPSFVTAFSR